MIKKFIDWASPKERWNELGHSFFGFIMGTLGYFTAIVWLIIVLVDELWHDGHWNYRNETKLQQMDFWFDMQSKLVSMGLGLFYIKIISKLDLSILYNSIIGAIFVICIFLLGWKHKYYA